MSELTKCPHCEAALLPGDLGAICPKCGGSLEETRLQSTMPLPDPKESSIKVGPYKLLEIVGEGGMGVVYLAEQDRPVRRRVALKLVKLGMDTAQVVARFEAERQALALMNHPNIAKVFDAGSTPEGRPFFAMEYVKGVPITRYCDTHRLGIRARLELFRKVCEGVQHAHQKGIIHRDLKPSNVLVSIQDDRPMPKIIDFGVAKATEQKLTERTMFTQTGALIGTLEYMSPEQAEMTGLDVDTRTDVYSLGVLLYELLTGELPFTSRELRESGYDEFRRKIREEDPPRASTRISRMGTATEAMARKRGLSSGELVRRVRGDLDWIVVKATEKDRTRRYESPLELAKDLGRYLGHEPVLASPPNTVYRVKKFVRRHRVGVAAGALVAVAVILGMVGTTVGLVRATKAEKVAAEEAVAANKVADFMVGLFEKANPWDAGRDTVRVEQVLDRGAGKIEEELDDQPLVKARLLTAMANAYEGLGAYDKAITHHEQALEIRKQVLASDDPAIAQNLSGMAASIRQTVPHVGGVNKRWEEGKTYLERALAIQRKALPPDHPDLAKTLMRLGDQYSSGGKDHWDLPVSESYYREALTICESQGEVEMAAQVRGQLGSVLGHEAKFDEGEQMFLRALEDLDKADRRGGTYARLAFGLGHLYRRYMADFDKALTYFQLAEEVGGHMLCPDEPDCHPAYWFFLASMATTYLMKGDFQNALPYNERLVRLEERFKGSINTGGGGGGGGGRFATIYWRLGEPEKAAPYFSAVWNNGKGKSAILGRLAKLKEDNPSDPHGTSLLVDLPFYSCLAEYLRQDGRKEDAGQIEEAVWAVEKARGVQSP